MKKLKVILITFTAIGVAAKVISKKKQSNTRELSFTKEGLLLKPYQIEF